MCRSKSFLNFRLSSTTLLIKWFLIKRTCSSKSFLNFRLPSTTMSAKSLGTFPVICAIDEVQNPLPLKTMLFKRHMTSIIGISDTFPDS